MIVTVHRRDHVLWHGDYPVRWSTYRWEPSPREVSTRPSGALLETAASAPIRVRVPIGSRLHAGRLLTHYDPHHGPDAASVWHLASRGLRGFGLAPDEPALPVHGAPTPVAVAFRSRTCPEARTYAAADAPAGHLETVTDPARVRTWPDEGRALEWLAAQGLGRERPVPVGAEGWIWPHVEPIVPDAPRGVEFRLRLPIHAGPAGGFGPEAIAVSVARAERRGQLLLFEEPEPITAAAGPYTRGGAA